MDHHIGRILGALEKSNKINDTVLVFLSDNGGTINTYSNNTPLRGWKYMFGEGGIRIPMIIAYADRLPRRQRKTGLVSAMDVMPLSLCAMNTLWNVRSDARITTGIALACNFACTKV